MSIISAKREMHEETHTPTKAANRNSALAPDRGANLVPKYLPVHKPGKQLFLIRGFLSLNVILPTEARQ